MDKITKGSRKNWFFSYNMIFDLKISEHAKIIYLYLCRCADEDGQSFPSYKTIAEKCSISRRTVIDATKELERINLLSKEIRIDKKGDKTSNLYTIYDTPLVQELHHPSAGAAPPLVQELHHPSAGAAPKGLPNEGLPNVKDYQVKSSQSHRKTVETDMTNDNDFDNATINYLDENIKKDELINPHATPSNGLESPSTKKTQDDYDTYKQIIQDNIEYDHFLHNRKNEIEMIDELVSCMLDVICTKGDTVKINGEEKSRTMVKSQYLKINSMDIDHVLARYKEQRHKITHLSNYLKTMLYTVKQENEHYYTNAVRADGLV